MLHARSAATVAWAHARARTRQPPRFPWQAWRKSPRQPKPQPRPALLGTFHGQQLADEFAWLRNPEDGKVIKYLQQENHYAGGFLSDTRALQDALYAEMAQHAGAAEESVPERVDDYCYYSRTDAGETLPVYCRRKGAGPEEVLIDQNALLREFGYVCLDTVKLSPDHQFMVYTVDVRGDECFEAVVVDLSGGSPRKVSHIEKVVGVELAGGGNTVFYTTPDEHGRPYRAYRVRVGSDHPELVYEEPDVRFYVDVSRTKDKKYITINSNSKTCSEVSVVREADPCGAPVLMRPREAGTEYFVDHGVAGFYIVTNMDNASGYKIVLQREGARTGEWATFYTPTDGAAIEDMDLFSGHCVVYERTQQGLPQVTILDVRTASQARLPLPQSPCALRPGANATFDSDTLRLSLSGPLMPELTMDYGLETGVTSVLRHTKLDDFREDDFEVQQIMADSGDVRVPITVVARRDLLRDGSNPLLLHGYGAYGHNLEPDFAPERLALFARGWVYAFCHVRGGAERGREWHRRGRLLQKHHSFEDFNACARRLHGLGFSGPARTAARGASAGGLLVAASCFADPGLVSSAILRVPFVDVLTAMLDEDLPLTQHEYDEWGNPLESQDVFVAMRSYSPYELAASAPAPAHMMVTASMRDQRVPFWQPAKFAARLRQHAESKHTVLLHTDWENGHFGTGGRLAYLREYAREYAFLYKTLGLPFTAG